jgi:hypothetical protein
MKPFAYVNPANEKDAVAALSKEYEKALPIGGGQDLLARMKDYVTQPIASSTSRTSTRRSPASAAACASARR